MEVLLVIISMQGSERERERVYFLRMQEVFKEPRPEDSN